MTVQGAAQHHGITVCFIKKNVLLKWTKYHDEPLVTQARMRKPGTGAEPRVPP
jgi:hypothetical protein